MGRFPPVYLICDLPGGGDLPIACPNVQTTAQLRAVSRPRLDLRGISAHVKATGSHSCPFRTDKGADR